MREPEARPFLDVAGVPPWRALLPVARLAGLQAGVTIDQWNAPVPFSSFNNATQDASEAVFEIPVLNPKDDASRTRLSELKKELQELQKAHFSLRMQHATQQLQNTTQLQRTRRDIARVRTVLSQKVAAK